MSETKTVSKSMGFFRSPVFWTFVASVLAIYPLVTLQASLRSRVHLIEGTDQPQFKIPEFSLVNQDGRNFGSKDLTSELWVASFFFTSCPTICPELTRQLKTLAAQLKASDLPVKIVTFTVDPQTDTPQVLKEHGQKHGIDFDKWVFLTGEERKLQQTIVDGFKQPMGSAESDSEEASLDSEVMAIAHGVRFFLIRPGLVVHGLYDANAQGIKKLLRDAQAIR